MTAHRRGSAAPLGIGHGHAVFQPGRQRKAQAMAWAARDQRQLLAVVEQLLVAGDAPEREGGGILRRISVGVELHHGGMTRSEERRVGKACVSHGRARGSPDTVKKKKYSKL